MKLEKFKIIEKDLEYWKNLFLKEKSLSFSSNSLKTYKKVLDEFIEYAYLERINNDTSLSIKNINRYFILGFLGELKERGLSTGTQKTYLDIIKSFLKYITENNEEAIDFIDKLKINVKNTIKIKEAFSETEINKIKRELKNILKNTKIPFQKYRNYLMLLLLAETGMRANEVITIQKNGIYFENDKIITIEILGKGNKERKNYLNREEFEEYFINYKKIKEKRSIASNYYFPKQNGDKITYLALWKFNKNFLKKLGIQKSGLHLYRHTFARQKVSEGVNLSIISQWLGHSDIKTTYNFYAKASEKDLKNIAIKK